MEAVVMRRKEVVQLLIEAGADMKLCNAVVIINNDIDNTISIIIIFTTINCTSRMVKLLYIWK